MKKTLLLLTVLLASIQVYADTWKKVTTAEELTLDGEYVVACVDKNVVMSANIGSNSYLPKIDVTIENNEIITLPANTAIITFEGSALNSCKMRIALEDGTSKGYYTTTGAKKMSLGTTGTNASVTFSNGDVKITFGTYGQLYYNSSSPRFVNYTSSQTAVQLFKKTVTEIPEVEPATPVVKVNGVVMESEFEIEEGTEITVSSENAVNLKESGNEEALNNPYIFAPEAGVHSYEFVGINGAYTSAALKFTVTVKEPVVEHFYLVNATTSLNEEDSYILVNIEKALAASTTIGNFAGTTSINMAADNLSCNFVNKDVLFFNLINNGDSWSLLTQNLGENNGYLCSASSSNYLQVRDDINANAKASITISELNEAQIKFQSGASSYLRYNASSPRFSCYNSSTSQQPVYLFSNNKLALAPVVVFDEDAKTIEVTVAEGCHIHYKHHVEKGAANAAALAEEGWNTQETNHYVFNVADESMFEQTTNTGDNGHFTFRAYDPESQKFSAETVKVLSHNALSGIVDIEAEGNGEVEYFNLQGVRVAEPANGLYLRRSGNRVEKVVVR